jgi:hypothetical protein
MSPAVRRRFAALVVVDGLGTTAVFLRAGRRRDVAAIADAAGAVAGWVLAAAGVDSGRPGRAAGLVIAGTAATLIGTGLGLVASRRAARSSVANVLLLVAGTVLGAAYLLVLRGDRSG